MRWLRRTKHDERDGRYTGTCLCKSCVAERELWDALREAFASLADAIELAEATDYAAEIYYQAPHIFAHGTRRTGGGA